MLFQKDYPNIKFTMQNNSDTFCIHEDGSNNTHVVASPLFTLYIVIYQFQLKSS
jgi:hypothetical protein